MKWTWVMLFIFTFSLSYSQESDSLKTSKGIFEFGFQFRLHKSENYQSRGPLSPYMNVGLRTLGKDKVNYGFLLTANTYNNAIVTGVSPRVYFRNNPLINKEFFLGLKIGLGRGRFFGNNIINVGLEGGYELSNGLAVHLGLDSFKNFNSRGRRFTFGARASGKNAFYTFLAVASAYTIIAVRAIGRSR